MQHRLLASATMFAGYKNGTIDLRSLAKDDINGICKIYPPDRHTTVTDCEPRHGYADLCGAAQPAPGPDPSETTSKSGGCSASQSAPRSALLLGLLGVLGCVGWLRRKRR